MTTFAGMLQGQASASDGVDCDLLPDTSEGPILLVTAPVGGSTQTAGILTIRGAALDCAADTGTGVDRVSVFLGPREAGGVQLGDATLRQPTPIHVLPADQYAAVGWSLTSSVPLKGGQPNEVYVYARSDVSSRETSVKLTLIGAADDASAAPASVTAVPTIAAPTPTPVDAAPQPDTVPTGPLDEDPPAE